MRGQVKLACSNLAWPHSRDAAALDWLSGLGYTGIEIAPTRIWPGWSGATPQNAREYAKRLADRGFSVPSMQSIYYGLDGVRLLDDSLASTWTLIEHTEAVARLAEALCCPVMVFGAPKMRDPGELPAVIAVERATHILRRLAQIAHDHGTTLCIEPNAQIYGCRFVWTSQQGAELVRAVDHPGFGLHLDAAAMHLEKEDGPATIRALAPMIRHFHVSEPALAGLASPKVDHQANLAALVEAGYAGWVSLESTDEAAFENSATILSGWTKPC